MDHSTISATPVAPIKGTAFKRVLATAVTAALAFAGVTAVAAPASAVETDTVTDGTFSWSISKQMVDHMSTKTPTEGATLDAGVFTFVDGTGTFDPETGESNISYSGSAYLAFAFGTSTIYSLTISNPNVIVDEDGNGQIRADVDNYISSPVSNGSVDDVLITTFTTGDGTTDTWTGDTTATLTDLPKWDNVLAPGSADAAEVGLTNGVVPLNGQSFTKDFLLSIGSGLRAHFYASGTAESPTASNVKKFPAQFTATAEYASPTVETSFVSASNADGYKIQVDGDGFRQVTNPGDAGIYAAVAPAGGAPGYSGADIGKYFGTKYIFANGPETATTSRLTDGKFSTVLTLPSASLDPNVEYSLYTWQSHTHSNTTQDTETPLDIDFDAVERYISTTELGLETATVVIGDDVVATATVEGATGSVEFFDAEASLGSADLVDGVASLTIEGLAVGTHSLTAVYGGNANYAKSTSSAQEVVVTKADGDVSLSLSRTSGTYGNIVNATANVAGTGAVAFLVDDKTVATAEIVEGVATAQLPRTIAAGTHLVVASYVGNDTTNAVDSAAVELTLAKATTAKVTVAGAKFKKNSYPVVTVKVSKLSNGFYPTGTLKVLVNGKVDRTVNLTEVRKGVYAVKLNKQSKAITVQASFKPDSASVTGNYSSRVSIKLK